MLTAASELQELHGRPKALGLSRGKRAKGAIITLEHDRVPAGLMICFARETR
jgi:hypothetical protein